MNRFAVKDVPYVHHEGGVERMSGLRVIARKIKSPKGKPVDPSKWEHALRAMYAVTSPEELDAIFDSFYGNGAF